MSLSADHKRILEQKRRVQIQTSAKKLFYMNGFAGTNMESIARDAGISKGLIYHYFKNKEELLLSFSEEVDVYLDRLRQIEDPLEALRTFGTDFLVNDADRYADAPPIQILLTTFADHRLDMAGAEEKNPILQDIGRVYLSEFFRRGIRQGIFRAGEAAVYGDLYWCYLLGKLLPVKKGHESQAPGVYVEEILAVFRT